MKASDIRRGHVLIIDGQPCRVMDFQHRTPGNLRAFVQLRLRNLTSGNTFDTRLSATEFVEDARLDTKEMQVMYRDSNGTHVMDGQRAWRHLVNGLGMRAVPSGEAGPLADEFAAWLSLHAAAITVHREAPTFLLPPRWYSARAK